ncbi:hypothetical protein [Pseudocolwellia agarivorans]|uniref:hypothetical protein n=1 Tax=Pseudocolwellia agarivorans TaxID=1911682 RepID=UPI003F882D99
MRQVFIPVLLVIAMLFSFVIHTEHLNLVKSDVASNAEQNCNLCQQNIDNIDNNVEILQQLTFYYLSYSPQIYAFSFHLNNSVTPPLRAPPVYS